MTIDDVVSVEVEWWLKYANSPTLKMTLKDGTLPKHDDFIYEAIPTHDGVKDSYPHNQFLLSTNLWPVVKFVYVDNADGNPTYYGALGGERKLVDGRVHKSSSGWSSRPGIVNSKYYDRLPGGVEIMDISVKEESSWTYWAGYCFSVDFAKEIVSKLPGVYLVRDCKYKEQEPVWTPSCHSTIVSKPRSI